MANPILNLMATHGPVTLTTKWCCWWQSLVSLNHNYDILPLVSFHLFPKHSLLQSHLYAVFLSFIKK